MLDSPVGFQLNGAGQVFEHAFVVNTHTPGAQPFLFLEDIRNQQGLADHAIKQNSDPGPGF